MERVRATLGKPIALENQTIGGNRTVDDADLGYLFGIFLEAATGEKAEFVMNPNVPSIAIQSNDGAGNVGAVEVGSGNVNLAFTGTSDLRVDGAPGASGDVITSAGTGSAPTWETPSGGGSVTTVAKAFSNSASASLDDIEAAIVWAATTFNTGSDVSVSGAVWTINTTGTYQFAVSLQTTNANRTELDLRTYREGVHLAAELVSNYVSRDTDQNIGGVCKIYTAQLTATDTVEFRGFGDTDGTCTILDAGTVCVVTRLL